MLLHQGHSSAQKHSFSRPKAGEYCWLTHTAKDRDDLWGVPMKPTEPPLIQTPPLLCSFPITAPALCQLRAGNSCPLQEAFQLARTNIGATASSVSEQRSWANSEKLQSCMKLHSSTTAYGTTKESLRPGEGKKPGCNQQGWVYAVSWCSSSYISEQLQKQKSVPWFTLGCGFPVADASGSKTKLVTKDCRTGKTLVSQWQTPALQLMNGSRRTPLCDQMSEDKHTYSVTEYPPSDVCCNAYPASEGWKHWLSACHESPYCYSI